MQELAIFDSGGVAADRVWQLGLFVCGVPLVAAFFLTCVAGWFAPHSQNARADAQRSRGRLALAYLFAPLVMTLYVLALLLARAKAEPGVIERYAWSVPGLVVGVLLFGLPIALRLGRAAVRSLPSAAADAARLEGATSWQMRRFIVWPHFQRQFLNVFARVFWHIVVGFGFILMVGAEGAIAQRPQLVSTTAGTAYVISLGLAALAALLLRNPSLPEGRSTH